MAPYFHKLTSCQILQLSRVFVAKLSHEITRVWLAGFSQLFHTCRMPVTPPYIEIGVNERSSQPLCFSNLIPTFSTWTHVSFNSPSFKWDEDVFLYGNVCSRLIQFHSDGTYLSISRCACADRWLAHLLQCLQRKPRDGGVKNLPLISLFSLPPSFFILVFFFN